MTRSSQDDKNAKLLKQAEWLLEGARKAHAAGDTVASLNLTFAANDRVRLHKILNRQGDVMGGVDA